MKKNLRKKSAWMWPFKGWCFLLAALMVNQISANEMSNDSKHLEKSITLKYLISVKKVKDQDILINGTVTDENGQPIPGVNVLNKATLNGTITDFDGNFTLSVLDDEVVLSFSYLGFKTQDIVVGNQTTINVVLEESATSLDEIVLVGYGTQSRSQVTTAISKLDAKVMENAVFANPASALQGTLAGVRVQSTSGQPGAAPRIIVRGGTSINNPNGASPLYVIDGVQRTDMNNIAADDIESVQVLKDAASTSIYGALGSNGVVLIKTKSGKAGKLRVNYRMNAGISSVGKMYDLADARGYLTLSRLGMLSREGQPDNLFRLGLADAYGTGNDLTNNTAHTTQYLTAENEYKLNEGWESMPDPVDPSRTLIFKDTDWQDVMFRTGIINDHHLSVSGGSETARMNASVGYLTQEGTAITSDFNRFTANLNGNLKVNDDLEVFASMVYARTEANEINNFSNTFARAMTLPPTTKFRFEDGSLAPGVRRSEGNPAYLLNLEQNNSIIDNLTLLGGLHYKILPGLTFDPQVSLFTTTLNRAYFMPSFLDGPSTLNTSRQSIAWNNSTRNTQADAVFNYKMLNSSKHNFGSTFGFSYVKRTNNTLRAEGSGAATDNIPTLNASSVPVSVSSTVSNRVIMGYFGRVNYDYDNKYFLSVNARYDGASNLGSKNKWGLFPGISLGWNLHEMGFWDVFPDNLFSLKLRSSYGVNGNIGNLSDYAAQGEYSVGNRYYGNSALQLTDLPNDDLQWEESKTIDVGADIGLFNGRINIIADYYRRETDNLITDLILPPSSGVGSVLTNLGSLENKGFEMELNAQLFPNTSNFQWNLSANAAYVKNTVLSLPENGTENNRIGGFLVWDEATGDYAWKGGIQEGGSIGDYYVYRHLGIYATDADAQAPGEPVDQMVSTPTKMKFGGDSMWQDTDGNGLIDSRDRVYGGNIYPKWTGGFTNSFSYKGFSMTARFDFTTGHTIHNYAGEFMDGGWKTNINMTQYMVDNSWKQQGDVVTRPVYGWESERSQRNLFGINDSLRKNTLYHVNGDYLAFREMTLAYDFQTAILDRLNISSLRLNLTGTNLGYFTNYSGLNPEEGGTDNGRYPNPRNFTLGVNVTF
tara:strand:- start:35745 stop:39053 length:3309 start_codon:yes stop_codon:yes gene_type:complete